MSESGFKEPATLSREILYSQVWATPISRLAAQYGITGTGLAKICARLEVPCPPRGYWAKKAAGKKVVQYRLPEAGADTPLKVTITPASPPSKASPEQVEMQRRTAQSRAVNPKIVVPEQLTRPHAVIAGWLAENKRERQEASRDLRGSRPAPFSQTDRRRHRILDTLFKALEAKGFRIKQERYPQHVHLEWQHERLDFQLREKQKQVRRPLTESEKLSSYLRERGWVQELMPTGLLVFSITTWLPAGLRREWKDQARTQLEADVPEIVATLELAGPALAKERQERAEAERRRWEEEQERYIERQRREEDERRWMRFLDIAHRCERAESARRLLSELEARPQSRDVTIGGHPVADWVAWAKEWLERYDPLKCKAETLFEEPVHV